MTLPLSALTVAQTAADEKGEGGAANATLARAAQTP
jgi:hypothetical protein